MTAHKSRRSFFKSAAAGGVMLASAQHAHAQRKTYKRKSPSSVEMMEIGVVICSGFNHIGSIWSRFMNPHLEEFQGEYIPRTTGMVMTYVWDPDPEEAKNFAKTYDLKVAKNYYDMVDKVDGIIFPDFYSTGWWPQLTKPYLEAGMPTLINRPFALSLRDAKEMIERSKKYNAPIYVPSAYESRYETQRLNYKLNKLLDQGAHITGAFAQQVAFEYPAHGLHGIYNLYSVLNPNVIAASLQADTWWGFDTAHMTWRCKQENNPDYFTALQMSQIGYSLGWAAVITTMGRIQEHLDRAYDCKGLYSPLQNRLHNYPTMYEFAKVVEKRKMTQTYEFILNKTTTFLTGFYSHCEKNGNMVACADLPEDWRAPEKEPERIPDEIFR